MNSTKFGILFILLSASFGCSFGDSFINGFSKTTIGGAVPVAPTVSYHSNSYKIFSQEAISPVSPSSTTGSNLTFSIYPSLPAGLTFDTSTGAISGTATVVTPLTTYTITVVDGNGLSGAVQISISTQPYFAVNTTADSADSNPGDQVCSTGLLGNCSLRAAIEEANALNVHSKIVLPNGTYLFSNTQLIINTELTIAGTSRAGTILDGNNTKRILDSTGAILNLSNLTVQNGNGDDNAGVKRAGGAIRYANVNGVMNLDNVLVANNQTVFVGTMYGGGGVDFVGDSITINQCVFSGNQTRLNGAGSGSSLGGGIRISTRTATITSTTFLNNTVDNYGGGLSLNATENVTVTDSTFDSNTSTSGSGGAAGAYVVADGNNSYFARNYFKSNSALGKAGGLMIEWAAGGTVENNTFYGNSTGIWWGGGLLITNDVGDPYKVRNNTFSNNSAGSGGQFGCQVCRVQISNNIFAASAGGANCNFTAATVVNLGGNVEDANQCSLGAGDLINTNPLLVGGGPQNNGGANLSLLLQPGSPAATFGVVSQCPAVDQRGVARTVGVCSSGSTQQ